MEREKLPPICLEGCQPLSKVVFEELAKAILSGKLPPRERLIEVQIAEEMGVSRTPVREAIRLLATNGFVVMVPRKGAHVAEISVKDITDIFEIREALEQLAVALAAERMQPEDHNRLKKMISQQAQSWENRDLASWVKFDCDFHQIIYNSTQNKHLIDIMQSLFDQINRYRMVCLSQRKVMKKTIEEHEKILYCIYKKNPKAAQQAVVEHLKTARQSLLQSVQKTEAAKNTK